MPNLKCKSGDLAIVVRSPNFPCFVGTIVRVTSLSLKYVKPCWQTDPEVPAPGYPGAIVIFSDDTLCPIRDPGNNAVDEVLQRVGKPADLEVTS